MRGVPDATLLIAGDGPERGRLDALIVRLGLTDRVRLLGAVPHADLPRLIAAADVSALASSSEGLANRSEEHTSELQSLMRISYAVFCLKKKNATNRTLPPHCVPAKYTALIHPRTQSAV